MARIGILLHWLIDLALQRAGWSLNQKQDREYASCFHARHALERLVVDAEVGRQQAKLYADCLEAMHGRRPKLGADNGARLVRCLRNAKFAEISIDEELVRAGLRISCST
jgi:type I site-specific restriction endonuclease